MTFARGAVVYGADPFKGEDDSRPWAIISNQSHPFQGDQYVVLALTTKTWHDDLILINEDEWVEGGTPDTSSIIPWSVETLEHQDIEFWQGSLTNSIIATAVSAFVSYVQSMECPPA